MSEIEEAKAGCETNVRSGGACELCGGTGARPTRLECPKCDGKDWTYTQGDDRLRCQACEPSSWRDAEAKIGAKPPSPRPLTDAELMALAALATSDAATAQALGETADSALYSRLRVELERRGVLGSSR